MPGIKIPIGRDIRPRYVKSWSSYWATRYISNLTVSTTSDTAQTITANIVGTGFDTCNFEYSTDEGVSWTTGDSAVNGILSKTGLTANTKYIWRARLSKGANYGNYTSGVSSWTYISYNDGGSLWAHIKPRDVTTLTKDGSERIAQINDLSGHDRHFVQATDGSKPLWDGTGANFNGKKARRAEALAQPCTIYLVYKIVGWNNGANVIGDSTAGTVIIQFDGSPNHRLMTGGTTAGGSYEARNKLGEKQLLTSIFDSANCESSVDGSIPRCAGSGNNTGLGYVEIGMANVIVYEVVIRSIHDTDATKIAIWNRLFAENGMTLTDEDLIVLAGQSNALGRSIASEITDPTYQAVLTDGYIYDYSLGSHTGTFKYELINPGVNSHSDTNGCFGFEQSLLYNLSSYLSKDIFIIKYGQSGTGLAIAAGKDWNIANSGELYDALKKYILEALKMLMYERKRGRVKFFIWMQGEQDAITEVNANAYAANLAAFMGALKTYITTVNGYYRRIDDTNIVICKIHTSVEWGYAATVRTAQQNYADANPSDTIAIETETRALMADNKHYTADSSIAIGIDIYNAIKDL